MVVVAVALVEAGTRAGGAPLAADADRVADAFVAAGVCQVWLFGSVARGESAEGSDIDLVAVHADFDYTKRWNRKCELAELGERVCGWPVDVLVTDLPEWELRSRLLTTFERRVRDQARLLRIRPISPPEAKWDKEIRLPASDDQEALYALGHAAEALESLERSLIPMEWEIADSPTRGSRVTRLCRNSQMAAECALKALVHLYGRRPPEDTHSLESLCRSLPRDIARSADRLLGGIDKQTMSRWRIVGTYPADYPEESAGAPDLAEPYVCAAVGLNRFASDHTEARVGPQPELDRNRSSLGRISAHLDDYILQTGRPRTGPSPLTAIQDLAPPRPRFDQQDIPPRP